ncbi:Sodium/hydrogen exchanger family-domain-containing protein [Suillus clintonianus]|uniref:Sodium/hydrogen exchanger family-domain-containing protein n=1 Tax=Suillus clintonianus TaxID=1904413 RepID=UPI001B886581|nr:Sodium/hydrogen exchanger family-domain-containing protein [Suillus clintonianus]KAG2120239.1 Sodium/hydrogen exchanger family-domain-containing protein [Suillus clintonianus]
MPPKISNDLVSRIWKGEVTGQGGLLSGVDPATFGTSDSLRVWIIQMGTIIMTVQLLSLGLSKIRQPKVIAGVMGGILLGPTAMGRIPGFTQHIFPAQSLPHLSVVANIGLCLFFLIIGLEIDTSVIKRNARLSLSVALSAMALSFGLGAAISVPLYRNFIDPSVNLTYFMLFTGLSFSINTFPALYHVLSALKLLDTTVGVIVLSAGACNDVVCWSLLALAVALVNATSGLTALWILLTCVAFTVFLMWPVRIALLRFARLTGSTENGPTISFMIVTVIILWACAFFAAAVGVNAILGAFLAGVIIVPREGGLANLLKEKLEDMVSIVFLPVYFTLSGLNTDFGLLNNGVTWGFTIAIICLDFAGKFSACTITARVSGMSWRDSSTVGSLMSCKGPVGLIVLNIGLAAGIFTERVFSMFVLEVLVLTFMITPLVSFLYPPERRRARALSGGISRRSITDREEDIDSHQSHITEDRPWRSRFTVVLDKLDHASGMLAATQLILPSPLGTTSQESEVCMNALRLIEMSVSDIRKPSAVNTLIHTDPALGVFRTFGELNGIRVSLSLSIVPYEDMSNAVSDHATRYGSELILLQLLPPLPSDSGDTTEDSRSPHSTRIEPNLFQRFFCCSKGTGIIPAPIVHSQFVRRVLADSKTDVALFIDPGASLSGTDPGSARHIFFPFFGGPDDRLALEFVMQLCDNPNVSATVVRMLRHSAERAVLQWPSIPRPEEEDSDVTRRPGYHGMPIQSTVVLPNTSYGQTRFESETADSILWAQYVDSHASSDMHPSIRAALSRIRFSEHSSTTPLHSAIQLASTRKSVLVVVGRSPRFGSDDHMSELENILEERGSVGQVDMRKTIGGAATAFFASGCATGVVVLQAANASTD